MKVKKLHIALISCVLALLCGFVYCSTTYLSAKNTTNIQAVTSYEEQYTKGLEILKMFADKLGETIIWL